MSFETEKQNTQLTTRTVFFGHLTPAVEDLRHQHVYHPVDVAERSPALAAVIKEIQSGRFGDAGPYEP